MAETVGTGVVHHGTMHECKTVLITGVKEVISFDELAVLLVTSCGQMTIEGDGLHISRLDLDRGQADVDATHTGIYYSKIKEKNDGIFRRFRD